VKDGKFRVASRKVGRAYYQNIGTISDDYAVRVVTKKGARLGDVEEGFLSGLKEGEAFIIAGKSVAVVRRHGSTAIVAPASGERVQTPRWMGRKMSLTARMAQEELRLRRDLRSAFNKGGAPECATMLQRDWSLDANNAERAAKYVERHCQAAPVPIDNPVMVERILNDRTMIYLFHSVTGRAVNRSLIWLLSQRLGKGYGSIVGNHDDHSFLLSFSARRAPSLVEVRECFHPDNFTEDLKSALEKTDLIGAKFRPICETGQLMPRRNSSANPGAKRNSAWNGRLLFETFLKYEPEHPLLREAVREILGDDLDQPAALEQATHLYKTEWEVVELPRPSPMAIPLFASFNRETLLKQDADAALDELVNTLYEEWGVAS